MITLSQHLKKGKDLSYQLSSEGRLRRKQLMIDIFKYSPEDNIFLAHGLPRADNFSIKELSFKYGVFGSDKFQEAKVERVPTDRSILSLDKSMQYGSGKGSLNLVQLIKKHADLVHCPKYSNWDVVLTTGNTEALYQSLTLLADRGDPIIVAKWCYPIALETFRGKGLRFIVADIDEEGIIPSSIEESVKEYYQSNPNAPKCKLIYTVPTGQNPSGATMSLERRQEFYRVCQKLDLMILEDDPYYFFQLPPYKPDGEYNESEFALDTLLPSLFSIDVDGRVVRMDSFSKVIAPGLRTAWITGPDWFTSKVEYLNDVTCQQPSGLSQIAMTEMLTKWTEIGFLDHLNSFRREFTVKRDLFVSLTEKYLKGKVTYAPARAGMFGWLKLNIQPENPVEGEPTLLHQIFDKLTQEKVVPIPGYFFDSNLYQLDDKDKNDKIYPYYIRICYTYVDPELLEEGMKRIGAALAEI